LTRIPGRVRLFVMVVARPQGANIPFFPVSQHNFAFACKNEVSYRSERDSRTPEHCLQAVFLRLPGPTSVEIRPMVYHEN